MSRVAPKQCARNDAEALQWLLDQHAAPCGDGKCDSVYCYIATRLAAVTAPQLPDGVEQCPTCGASTNVSHDCLYSIHRVTLWKEQDPEHADVYDAAIAELRRALNLTRGRRLTVPALPPNDGGDK